MHTPHPPYLCQIKPSGMEGIYFKGKISAFWNTILKASCFQAGWRRWVVRNEETARSQWKLQINRASLAFLASLPYGYVVPGTTGWYGVPLWIGLGLQPHLSPFAPLNFPLLLSTPSPPLAGTAILARTRHPPRHHSKGKKTLGNRALPGKEGTQCLYSRRAATHFTCCAKLWNKILSSNVGTASEADICSMS